MVVDDLKAMHWPIAIGLVATSMFPWILDVFYGFTAIIGVVVIAAASTLLFRRFGRVPLVEVSVTTGLVGVLYGVMALLFVRDFQDGFMGQEAPVTAGFGAFAILAVLGVGLGLLGGWVAEKTASDTSA